MPTDPKGNRYHKRSRSSSSERAHRVRDRRTYEKDKPERFERYHRRSRSRSPPKPQVQKSKYTMHYQYKSDKRYEESYRDGDKNKYYESSMNKGYDTGASKHYDSSFNRRDQFEKRDREKGDEHSSKPKFNRYEENENFKNRQKQLPYERRGRERSSPERERKHRRSISSHSKSKSPKQQNKFETKAVVNKKSPPQKHKDQDPTLRVQKQEEIQKEKPTLPVVNKVERDMDVVEKKIIKQFANISPIKRLPITEFKQPKQEQVIQKTKVNKFQLVLNEARQNLTVSPPPSSFFLLQTFNTMNKFQKETLDPNWMNYLKKDLEKFQQAREKTMLKLAETAQTIGEDGGYLFGKQYMWIKEDRNEQELDLRFRFQEFKQHNFNLNESMRKLRFLD